MVDIKISSIILDSNWFVTCSHLWEYEKRVAVTSSNKNDTVKKTGRKCKNDEPIQPVKPRIRI